jgi:hypothetical protein
MISRAAWKQTPDHKTATPPPWSHLKEQKLSLTGKKVLGWLEDAQSCLPQYNADDVKHREQVIISDLLKCAEERSTTDIATAASEYARRNPDYPFIILGYLDPLVFSESHTGDNQSFGLWRVQTGSLAFRDRWYVNIFSGETGRPSHYGVLERPIRNGPRANIELFKKQITDERSHWHLHLWHP